MFVISFAKAFLIDRVNRGGWVVSGGAILSAFGLINAYPDLIIRRLEAVSKDRFKIQVEIWKGKILSSWVFNAMEHEIKVVNEFIIAIHHNDRLQVEITNPAIKVITSIEEGSQTQGKISPIQNDLKAKELILKQADCHEEIDKRVQTARNLLEFYKRSAGKSVKFTPLDYEKFLGVMLADSESRESERRFLVEYLEYLVCWGALSTEGGRCYSFTDKFEELISDLARLSKKK